MCICVDCAWVDRCKTYHVVETQHGSKHLSANPDFQGVNPRIHVSVMDLEGNCTGIEWDVRECGSYKQEAGKWMKLRPGEPVPS